MKYELRWPLNGRAVEVDVWLDELSTSYIQEVGSVIPLGDASLRVPSRTLAISQRFPLNINQAVLIGGDFYADNEDRLALRLPLQFAVDVLLSEATKGFRPGLPREFVDPLQRGLLREEKRPSGVLALRAVAHDAVGSSPLSFLTLAQSLIRLLCESDLDEGTIRRAEWWINPMQC